MSEWTASDLPSFAGRTVIVTGANSGLGEVTARELARVGARVILAVRITDKGDAAAARMSGPYALTVDGFESQIGSNHQGHFALTNLLLPKITDRVVTVSSIMHLAGWISLKDLNWRSGPTWRGRRTARASWRTCCSPVSCSAVSPPAGRRCGR